MAIKFRAWQLEAISSVQQDWQNDKRPMVQAVMGSGKSITIAELAKQNLEHHNVIVSVPNQMLVEQISDTIQRHVKCLVGRYYTHEKTIRPVTVVCHDSLGNLPKSLRPDDPFASTRKTIWIADEAHKTECDTVKNWVDSTSIIRRVGFSATPWRASERESVSLFDTLAYRYTAADAYRDGYVVMPTIVHPSEAGTINSVCWQWIHDQDRPGVCNAVDVEDAEIFAESLDMPTMCVHYKSTRTARDAREFLEMGGARCVVYVDMLSEGFDCPSIEWMCLRRPVSSRVRFAQEVGRGLRAKEGKSRCLLFDPHDLWSSLSITFDACLGEIDEDDSAVIPILKLGELFERETQITQEWNPSVEAVPVVRSYLRATRVALQMGGADLKTIPNNGWRGKPASTKQLAFINTLFSRMNPDEIGRHRTCLTACYFAAHAGILKKGDCQDLTDICLNWRRLE